MNSKTPAQSAEERRRIEEMESKEIKISENLLSILQKQVKQYDIQQRRLKEISLQKLIINGIQKEYSRQQVRIDALEQNILKRNQKIIEETTKINNLEKIITNSRIKGRHFSEKELSTLMDFKRIYGNFVLSKTKGTELSEEELKILQRVATLRRKTVGLLLTETGTQASYTRQLIQQATLQQKQNNILKQKTKIEEEILYLVKEQQKESQLVMKDWFYSLPVISNYRNKLGFVNDALQSMGIKSKYIGSIMSTSWLIAGSAFLILLKQIYDLFKELDAAAFVARKEMGMMRAEHVGLRQQAEDLYKEWANLGVNVESVYKTQKAISMELGSALSATKNIVEQAALMSAQFGIGEDTTIRMLKTLGQMGGTTVDAQRSMVGFATSLANAAGVPLPQVMEDVAKASETTRTMMTRLPLDIIKASIEARRMGTTLDKMTASSRKILNFTESIEAEMEASVLLGEPINLQLARQLAYHGQIEEANKEILRLSRQINFEKLDVFSMESFAHATGKSVDELKSMLQADREHNQLIQRAAILADKGDISLQNQLNLTNQLKNANEAAAKVRGEDYLTQLKQEANQERITSISNAWKKIIMELGQAFLPIIDDLLKITADILPYMVWGFKSVVQVVRLFTDRSHGLLVGFRNIGRWVLGIVQGGRHLLPILKTLGKFTFVLNVLFATWNVIKSIYTGIKRIGEGFKMIGEGQWGKGILKILGEVGRTILGIGAGILEGFFGFIVDIPILILKGLGAVGVGWAKAAAEWAESSWEALKDWFGFSPSKVGLSIVKGITSIGGMLVQALTNPFGLALDLLKSMDFGKVILDSLSSIGGGIISIFKKSWDVISNLFGGNVIQPSVGKPAIMSKASSIEIPMDRPLTTEEIKSYRELDNAKLTSNTGKTTTQTETEKNSEVLLNILNAINKLNDNLISGKIQSGPINLDGQLLSTNMNRGIRFRGNYGAMVEG